MTGMGEHVRFVLAIDNTHLAPSPGLRLATIVPGQQNYVVC